MSTKKETTLVPTGGRDPFAILRQMNSEFDRLFEGSSWPSLHWHG